MKNSKSAIYLYRFGKDDAELPVKIYGIEELRDLLNAEPIFREAFITTYIITEGSEPLIVNGHKRQVEPDDIIITLPGEVWQWSGNTSLQGYCLIFIKEFFLHYFNDDGFFYQFEYLKSKRKSPFLKLDESSMKRVVSLLDIMLEDYHSDIPVNDKRHITRAHIYELLILLKRAKMYNAEYSYDNQQTLSLNIDFFTELVNRYFTKEHSADFYASKMAITTNYLNKIVRSALGISTKAYINEKIIAEATQQLRYTELSIKEISHNLGFEDASYFIRFFGKNKGMSPMRFRTIIRENQE